MCTELHLIEPVFYYLIISMIVGMGFWVGIIYSVKKYLKGKKGGKNGK